jgi:hypothetical protein
MRKLALAPKEVAFELLNQGRLGDVALLGGGGEIERACRSQKVPNLMHFHGYRPDGMTIAAVHNVNGAQ